MFKRHNTAVFSPDEPAAAASTGGAAKEPVAPLAPTPEPEVESRTVPLTVLKQMEEKLKNMTDQNKLYQTQLSQPRQQPVQQPAQQEDYFTGMSDDDIVTVADQKKLASANRKELQGMVTGMASEVEQLKFAVSHPDYKEVIPKLKIVLDQDPELSGKILSDIQNSRNPLQTAYNYARLVKDTAKPAENDFMSELEKIMANENKPSSPASVGSGSAATSGGDKYSSMSDADFLKHTLKVKGLAA